MTLDRILSDVTPDEARFLHESLARLRGRDPWSRGYFAEALVAETLPGASCPRHSASPYDIEWNPGGGKPIKIAVRATGAYSMDHEEGDGKKPFAGSWKFPRSKGAWLEGNWLEETRRCWADVVVLGHHKAFQITQGWSFYVLSRSEIEDWPSESLRPNTLKSRGFGPVERIDLADEVSRAATR